MAPKITRINENGEVSCPSCKRWLPPERYFPAPKGQRGQYSTYCRDCMNEKQVYFRKKRQALRMTSAELAKEIEELECTLQIKKEALQELLRKEASNVKPTKA